MAGYSGTPLVKKLGIKSGFNLVFVGAPNGFSKGLDLPTDIEIDSRSRRPLDFALLFGRSERELRVVFSQYAETQASGDALGGVAEEEFRGCQ